MWRGIRHLHLISSLVITTYLEILTESHNATILSWLPWAYVSWNAIRPMFRTGNTKRVQSIRLAFGPISRSHRNFTAVSGRASQRLTLVLRSRWRTFSPRLELTPAEAYPDLCSPELVDARVLLSLFPF
ncbi:hypothetical protein F4781DRAFT_49102 [Annulohypoxylon bovei var. microspora]|nr:hypothetical protein F4781DRAFT_49102 [Annulohypoxylon bovei var. microspora]